MKYAIIEAGIVTNVVVADAEYAELQGWVEVEIDGRVEMGWSYVDGEFVDLRPEPAPALPPPAKEELLAQLQALQAQIEALAETPS
jgi:hypothetical protein